MKKANYRKKRVRKGIAKADIDVLPNDNLCDECKKLGYCKSYAERQNKIDHSLITHSLTDEKLRNLVPINTRDIKGIFTKKHLGVANLAFHHEDYETAILNYQTVLENDPNNSSALLCLAICYFFLEQYEIAMNYADRVNENYELMESFLLYCQNKLKSQEANETAEVEEMHLIVETV